MTPADADRALFGDALACAQQRPAAFVPGAVEATALNSLCLHAEAFLQSVAVIEDSRTDEPDEHGAALALHRIEARLDLLTALVARLAQRDGGDAWQAVRWSALGAFVPAAGPVDTGARGVFRIQPCEWLPEALQLPAGVLAADASGGAWLRFEPLTPGLTQALERHLFRVHRREIAGRRGRA